MFDWWRLSGIVFAAVGLAGNVVSSNADGYSDKQIELAGKIGTAVALSRICNGTVPTTAVIQTLEASGLAESDLLGNTLIRERMERQASAVMLSTKIEIDSGKPQAEIVKSACDGFRASFGPNGFLAPEIPDSQRRAR